MKVTIDTNPLVRFLVRDDEQQAAIVDRVLGEATLIAITLPCFCELVWVLRRVYRLELQDIRLTIEALLRLSSITTDRRAVEAGLAAMRAGQDFADGVIAEEGRRLGGDTFLSFDKKAVALVKAQGFAAQQL